MPSPAQTQLHENCFFVTHTLEGLPEGVKIHAVSEIVCTWDPVPVSSCQDRSGSENHEIYDPGQVLFDPITFSCHGNKDETKATFDMFDKAAKGNPLRGDMTLTVYNPKEARKEILSATMYGNTLISYCPLGAQVDVSAPDTLSFEFCIRPERVEFKAG